MYATVASDNDSGRSRGRGSGRWDVVYSFSALVARSRRPILVFRIGPSVNATVVTMLQNNRTTVRNKVCDKGPASRGMPFRGEELSDE